MVAQCLSFTEAAKRIFIGQSALSKHIADLEEEMGVELLIRHHRSLELTAAGKTLLRESVNLLDRVSDIIEKTRQADRGIRGSLKIGCFGGESAFFPYALKRFHSLYPQISIDLQLLTLRMIETALESEELDLGFVVILGNELKPNKFMQRLIYRVPLCFLMPSHHPYAGEPSIDIAALSNESFILLSAAESDEGIKWFNAFCEKRGFLPSISTTTTRMDGVLWLVEAGFGISFWSKNPTLTRYTHPGISFVDMQGKEAYSNIVAQWKKNRHNPAISLFLNMLETIDKSN
jgi:DNA-binding transcriptional LysR family regulator